ncbi:hypothetical protein [Formosa sp. A9]|uniref:hypothetical protein n=1 Tax=Formosa sp. A9 TaxID=3442641 RepID=UPI003EBBACD1
MDKYININETPYTLVSIPKVKGTNINYNSQSNSTQWFEDGYRQFVAPEYSTSTHKLGGIIYDEVNDIGTREVLPLTTQELEDKALQEQQRLIQEQVDLQILREQRGKEEFRLMTASLRAQLGAELELADYNALELLLEPLGDTICFGKWTKCYMMLVELGTENVGTDLYNQLEAKLRAGIIDLYDEHDYPFEI